MIKGKAVAHLLGLVALLLMAVGILAPPGRAADPAPVVVTLTGTEPPELVDKLLAAAAKQGRPVEVRLRSAPVAADPPSSPDIDRSGWAILSENFTVGVEYGWDALPSIRALPADLARAWRDVRNGATPVQAVGTALLIAGISALAGYATMRSIRLVWRQARLEWSPLDGIASRLGAGLATLLSHLIGLAAFLALAWTASAQLLPEPDLARWLAEGISAQAIGFIAYWAVGEFLLGPGRPQRRLLPIPNAERHFRLLRLYGFCGPAILMTVDLFAKIGSSPLAIAGWFSLTGGAITLYKLWWFWTGRADIALLCGGGAVAGMGRRALATAAPVLLMASAVLIWAVGRVAAVAPDGARWANAAGATQIIIILVPILAAGVAALVRESVTLRRCAETGRLDTNPILKAWGLVAATTCGMIVWVLGLWFMARLWQFFLLEIFSPAQVAALEGPIAVIAVLLVGWMVWSFLEALFQAYMPQTRAVTGPDAEDESAEQQVQSRFGTILPLVRAVVLAGIAGITALIALSRLGVDIAPLLAGFGIIGLAISFGSQALVRDIVSGIFFIADDAFRVGEYIDTGRLKGTVERITLRSVQLRHQSGLVHTIPFGQIASVTNSSREWATVKFNIRLDRDTDIEKARKIIKRVGLAMQEEAEFAPHLILPLKMQGVAEIDDTAIIVRLKFTSKPDKSSWLQREGLKRVYAALRDAGVIFASNAVTVRGSDATGGAAASVGGTAPVPVTGAP